MSNLLDLASIVLTPTAYNNGEALCIKPDDASGDFQFSRNSAATRVNAQGLVENVQILSSNLVTNGDFDTDSDWTKGTGWSISDGKAVAVSGTSSKLTQSISGLSGKKCSVTFTLSNYGGNGTIKLDFGSLVGQDRNANGTYTEVGTYDIDRLEFFKNSSFSGSIDNVSVIEITTDTSLPRINYEGFSYDGSGNVVPDSGCGSWLFEPQSTNLIPYSETLGNNTTSGGISFTYNNSISPDGTQNAALVSVTSANDRLQPSFAAVNSLVAISIFLKHNGTDFSTQINTFNTGTGTLFGARAHVTATDVTFTSYSGGFDSASFVDYGNGWFRVIVVCQSTTGTTFVQWRPTSVNATLSYPCFGFQVEVQDFATSYIKTDSGSSVTRNQDVCTNGGSLASINSTEGVLYAEIAALANDGTVRFLGLNDGSNNNRVVILYDSSANRIRAIVSSGGTKYVDFYYNVTDVTDFNKVAVKYKANNFALWIDGVERATDTSGSAPIGLNDLEFNLNSGGPFFGKTKALAVFPYLSDSELQSLTTI